MGQTEAMEPDLSRTLAVNLRRRRRQLQLSQDALAYAAGLHRTYIGAVEREEKNITLRTLQRIAGALDIEAWRLVAPRLGGDVG